MFGNIHEIAQFQRQFLISLEEAIQMDSPFFHSTDLKNYRVGIDLKLLTDSLIRYTLTLTLFPNKMYVF